MPEFDLDNLKKTWQEQTVQPKYGNSEILEMLNKGSRNYVKYILWISIAEFLLFFFITLTYLLKNENNDSYLNVLKRLGLQITPELQLEFSSLYLILKILSLVVTIYFVLKFYYSFKKIHVEENLKKFILQIINFRKTVNYFIFTNIALLLLFTIILTGFIFYTIQNQSVSINNNTLIGLVLGIIVTTALTGLIIWIYYRIVYGILNKRLGKNLKQLTEIEENNT